MVWILGFFAYSSGVQWVGSSKNRNGWARKCPKKCPRLQDEGYNLLKQPEGVSEKEKVFCVQINVYYDRVN